MREWLIKLIAGGRPVLMNVSMTVIGELKGNGQKPLIHKCGVTFAEVMKNED
jgi:hypothetical protein